VLLVGAPTCVTGSELGFRARRLEELNGISGGILDQGLPAADSGDDVAATSCVFMRTCTQR